MERLWYVPTYVIVTLLVAGPLGAFLGLFPGLTGFSLMLLGLLVGVVFGIGLAGAAAFAAATGKAWRPRAVRAAAVPLAVGVATLFLVSRSQGVPMIHDISTDFADRLEFTKEVKEASPNKDPDDALRAQVEAMQKAAYPAVAAATLALPPPQAFARAKQVAEAMPGWQVTSADTESGRIEAIATTGFFHFKDDIVIRVRADGSGSRVDMRSRSRVGQSDLGANAKRVEAYMSALAKAG